MKRFSFCLLVSLSLATLIAPEGLASSLQPRGQSLNSKVAGNWILRRVGDKEGRNIYFDAQLGGAYFIQNNEKRSITSAKFDGKTLTFKVPDLKLYFELQLVKDHFEGKMTAYGTTERLTPEPVMMTRK